MDQKEIGKTEAALTAFSLIKKKMRLGIGTGSTVFFLIKELRRHHDLDLEIAFSSERSQSLLTGYP